ncbi:GNAT family N-acetyltransferase [Phytohabitans sp. ZYX-F-186]|uniref:GNAT family N-acetyltransferase n=1 Tax=Phytohabitans maris TaxID=3071409 RepID=A0ABU0ZA71_9ACTN|nr:GNAT family N-acetyltransferase [Phytohabitans sp. ZYX-F-186]MDQ7903227.1 GNAT family N-acetyltransferase [Phytohabitans sp. ZYX-F-186]
MNEARVAASAAADRLGVQVVELSEVDDQRAAAELLQRVWSADSPDQLVNASMMRAFAHSGNYVVGAYRDGRLVGAAVAFLGTDHLHSHIAGVEPGRQGSGVGYAMKLHQRAWALDRGLPAVCWTYDPLIRRNAYFNLGKLGARATAYLPDFYGPMDVGTDAGGPTDRMYVRWDLTSPAASAAARGECQEADPAGGVVVLGRDGDGAPVPVAEAGGRRLLVAAPLDVVALRGTDPPLALRWRFALREAIMASMLRGYRIAGVTRDGWYVLEAA